MGAECYQDRFLLVSIRVLVGIAQEQNHSPRPMESEKVSIRVLVGIAQEQGLPHAGLGQQVEFQSVCWSE